MDGTLAVGMTDTVGQQLVDALDEIDQLRGAKAALQEEIERLRELNDKRYAQVEWLTKVLTDIHDDGRCPSWICEHIEIILRK